MLLTSAVIGSGIMAERLAGGNLAVALLANTGATVAVLATLIALFGPISGAHFNPAVSFIEALRGNLSVRVAVAYAIFQIAGCVAGAFLAHAMFELPIIESSIHLRAGPAQWLSEAVATAGLILVVIGSTSPREAAWRVAAWIGAAYWFTASTSFANPAITIARALSNTFAGIAPNNAPAFIISQLCGALIGLMLAKWLQIGTASIAQVNRRKSKPETPKKGGLVECFYLTPSFSPSRPARGKPRARKRASRDPDGCAAMACLRIGQSRPRKYRRAIMSNHNLFSMGADGAVIPATSEAILVAARQVLAHRVRRGASLQSPQKAGEYLTVRLGHLDYEVFGLILLDKRHRVIECIDMFRGTIDGASVHPREVVKLALQKSAAACIVYHNHPSGVADQSQADELITARLKEALALIDVRLIDHVVLAGPSILSFAQRGLL